MLKVMKELLNGMEDIKVTTLKNLQTDINNRYFQQAEIYESLLSGLSQDEIGDLFNRIGLSLTLSFKDNDDDFQNYLEKGLYVGDKRVEKASYFYSSLFSKKEGAVYCYTCKKFVEDVSDDPHEMPKCDCYNEKGHYRSHNIHIDSISDKSRCIVMESEAENLEYYDSIGSIYKTFFYPIVNQKDLFVLGQFNIVIKVFLVEKNNGELELRTMLIPKVSTNPGMGFSQSSVLIYSKKHGKRFINPNNGQIMQAYDVPKNIKESFKFYSSDDDFRIGYSTPYYSRYDELVKNLILDGLGFMNEDLMEKYEAENEIEGEFNSFTFLNTFFKPDVKFRRKSRRGVHRFDIDTSKDKEIFKAVEKVVREKVNGSVFPYMNVYDGVDINIKLIEKDGNKHIRRDRLVMCECGGLGRAKYISNVILDDYVDNCFDEDKHFLASNRHILNDQFYYEDLIEDVYCDKCNDLIITKNDPLNNIELKSSPTNIFVVYYTKDSKGRLVERVFNGEVVFESNDPDVVNYFYVDVYEKYRTIIYEPESNNRFVSYEYNVHDKCFDDESLSHIYISTNEIYPLQTKEEIREELKGSKFMYSGLEDVLANKDLSKDHRYVFAGGEKAYIMKWVDFSSLELLARVDRYSLYLRDVLNTPDLYSLNNKPLVADSKNIQDLLNLNSYGYNVVKNIDEDSVKIDKTFISGIYILSEIFEEELNLNVAQKIIDLNLLTTLYLNEYNLTVILEHIDTNLTQMVDYLERVYLHQRIVDYHEIIGLWMDYVSMGDSLGLDLTDPKKKYPSSLKREHDIVSYDYNKLKSYNKDVNNYEEIEAFKDFEFEGDKFVVISPKDSYDLFEEGRDLNHCVSSYDNYVVSGSKLIMFVRNKNNINKSLYTVEIDMKGKKVAQVRGKSNSSVKTKEEKVFMNEYLRFVESVFMSDKYKDKE